jgi:hypothetical protein
MINAGRNFRLSDPGNFSVPLHGFRRNFVGYERSTQKRRGDIRGLGYRPIVYKRVAKIGYAFKYLGGKLEGKGGFGR